MAQISLIVAMAKNRVIGRDNALPWHLPADLKHFRAITMGKPIVMGRKTFDSIGKALPGRLNIVISRGVPSLPEGVLRATSVSEAFAQAIAHGATEIMVIGGAQIYAEAMPLATRLYLTRVDAEVGGDAWFPALDDAQWREVACERFAADEANPQSYEFAVLERVAAA